ncbi:laccase domain-containing protein [Leptospira langatensis]|uniref:Laccase domain-containing protein n=1 Tax=Leptospira langatensis TaxID=2484983 RepID=A0A5F1ZY27_9LEPT|nr:polyphenol oxidase family protein [Leptospira langatensis]TGK04104.1 laccase domain-containing protein [Leptospira langatensis]TGL43584.1 laccase domain-containing protein [Leptospira langatensis]
MITHRFFLEDKRSLRLLVLGSREISGDSTDPEYIRSKVSQATQIPGSEIFLIGQEHGTTVIEAEGTADGVPTGDALFTTQPKKILVVKTADCLPIFFWTGRPAVVGVIHSGWKGTLAGITEKTLGVVQKKYGIDLELVHFYLGPYATGKNYEVGEDVASLFRKEVPNSLKLATEPGKFLLEQKIFLTHRIKSLGVQPFLETAGVCTMNANSGYFSHRRGDTNRNLNCIWLE